MYESKYSPAEIEERLIQIETLEKMRVNGEKLPYRHESDKPRVGAPTDQELFNGRAEAAALAEKLKIEEGVARRYELKKFQHATPASPYRLCALTDCTGVVMVNASSFCEPHRKKWGQYSRAGFTLERFIEFNSKRYCDCCGNGLKEKQTNVDHDHSHNSEHPPSVPWCNICARGVVCSRCNLLLAALDDLKFMKNASQYLDRHEINLQNRLLGEK